MLHVTTSTVDTVVSVCTVKGGILYVVVVVVVYTCTRTTMGGEHIVSEALLFCFGAAYVLQSPFWAWCLSNGLWDFHSTDGQFGQILQMSPCSVKTKHRQIHSKIHQMFFDVFRCSPRDNWIVTNNSSMCRSCMSSLQQGIPQIPTTLLPGSEVHIWQIPLDEAMHHLWVYACSDSL